MRRFARLPGESDFPETEFQILDGETQTHDWPPLLRALAEHARTQEAPPKRVRPPVPDALARLGADRPGQMVVGVTPGRPPPSTPDYDGLAAQVIREGIGERAVHLDLVRIYPTGPVPAPVDRDLIVVGGPGSHRLSEAVNQALARRALGLRGFYFTPAGDAHNRAGDLVKCWRLRAHDLPGEPGIPDPEDPYARLSDGRKADVGILYAGANPLASRHWLIWVAGLGAVGTVGAALALKDVRVMEALARGLTGAQAYSCALVRYRFADEQRPLDGALASLALTRGVLRPP